MRALGVVGALAGLAALLATATGGPGPHGSWPIGWTGYAPLGNVGCSPLAGTTTLTFHPSGGQAASESAHQIVCTLHALP